MSRGGIAIAPWLPLGGLGSPLGGLTSPILTLRGLTSLTVTLIGLLDTSLPARGGLTSFIVTLGGLISLMTDLRGFTSMVIRLGSSTSIATMALYRRSALLQSCGHHSSLSIFTSYHPEQHFRLYPDVSLHQIGMMGPLELVRASGRHHLSLAPLAAQLSSKPVCGDAASEREGFREQWRPLLGHLRPRRVPHYAALAALAGLDISGEPLGRCPPARAAAAPRHWAAHPRPAIRSLIRSQLRASWGPKTSDPWDFGIAITASRPIACRHQRHFQLLVI